MTAFEPGDRVSHCLHGPGDVVRKTRRQRYLVEFDRKASPCRVLAVNLDAEEEGRYA